MAQEIADSTLLDTWASGGNIVEPDISKIIEGWQLGEQPPHEYMNWLQNTFGSKLNHILKNGVASWNNETEYLAGSSVQHNGNVWLCKTTNTNSEPADVNANWKRIITIEALTTVLGGYVALTGDQTIAGAKTFSSNPLSTATQSTNSNALTKYSAVVKNSGNETIAGVKTFSSSPIVPTPTNNGDAVNKEYVDTGVGVAFVANDARVKTALNASGEAPIYACRAWVNFRGTGTIDINGSGNVSSVTDNSVGTYTLNYTAALPAALYTVAGSVQSASSFLVVELSNLVKTTTQLKIVTVDVNGNKVDLNGVYVNII